MVSDDYLRSDIERRLVMNLPYLARYLATLTHKKSNSSVNFQLSSSQHSLKNSKEVTEYH